MTSFVAQMARPLRGQRRPGDASPRRILVILDDCDASDALRARFCLQALRRAYADAEIVLLVAKRAAAAVERAGFHDRLVVSLIYTGRGSSKARMRIRRLIEAIRLVRHLGRDYDLVVTLGCGSTVLNLVGRLVGRKHVGYANRFPWLLSGRPARYNFGSDPVDQNRALLRQLGIDGGEIAWTQLDDEHDVEAVERLLAQHRILPTTAVAVLHTGSDWACQQWLPERWAALGDWLVAHHGLVVVFTGLKREGEFVESVQRTMRHASASVVGSTDLHQLSALIARASLCISVDSVTHDLALATRTPSVILAGASDSAREAVGRHVRVIDLKAPEAKLAISASKQAKFVFRGCLNYECPLWGLREISVDQVREAVDELLAAARETLALPTAQA